MLQFVVGNALDEVAIVSHRPIWRKTHSAALVFDADSEQFLTLAAKLVLVQFSLLHRSLKPLIVV